MGEFVSTRRKGFHMTFDNGIHVSVQFGAGNYCDNHDSFDFSCSTDQHSSTAEVAVWHEDHDDVHDWLDVNYFIPEAGGEGHGGVCGWLTPEQVAELLYKASIETRDTLWQKYGEFYKKTYEEELVLGRDHY